MRVGHDSELLARRSDEARTIRVLAKPGDHRIFWLDEEDLDWFIRTMIVEFDLRGQPQLRENEYGGVPKQFREKVSSVEGDAVGANVEHFEVKWNFDSNAYEVTFYAPPELLGKIMVCKVADLNEKKAALVGVNDWNLTTMTYEQKTNVANDYVRFMAASKVQDAMKRGAAN